MDRLTLDLDHSSGSYQPGEALRGRVSWWLEKTQPLEVRLFWYTEGKGSQDVEIVDTHAPDAQTNQGNTTFSFTLPDSPYSFSGKLISLIWAVEVVSLQGDIVERKTFTLSPTGREIVIGDAASAV